MSEPALWRSFARWIKFNLVGGIGICVQLAALWMLTSVGVSYMLATALAVESAVLHNYVWHERFTWVDRCHGSKRDAALRLLRFNVTTGGVSIAGNLLFMRLLVGGMHLRPLIANLASIALCSILNFLVSDRWVFRSALSPQ